MLCCRKLVHKYFSRICYYGVDPNMSKGSGTESTTQARVRTLFSRTWLHGRVNPRLLPFKSTFQSTLQFTLSIKIRKKVCAGWLSRRGERQRPPWWDGENWNHSHPFIRPFSQPPLSPLGIQAYDSWFTPSRFPTYVCTFMYTRMLHKINDT